MLPYIWFGIALVGLLLSGVNSWATWELLGASTDGLKKVLVRMHLRHSLFLMLVQGLFVFVGIVAIGKIRGPLAASGLIAAASALTADAILQAIERHHIMRLS